MPDYANLAKTSSRLVKNFGRAVTIRKYTQGSYDPNTGTASNTYADTVFNALTLNFGNGQTLHNGNQIQANDARLLLEPSAVFSITDKVFIGGIEWGIVSIGSLHPDGTELLHDLHIRR